VSRSTDSIQNVIKVALSLCIVCSVVVSAAVVLLKPVQVKNKTLNLKENILRSASMLSGPASKKDIEELFATLTPKIVDLETGEYVEPSVVGYASIDDFDAKKVKQNPKYSKALTGGEDIAGLKRQERYAKVFLVRDGEQLSRIILPVRGYGLWSTLYGYMAVEGDGNTVVGLGFYEHGETPGLGDQVDKASWKSQWPGKKIYDDSGEPAVKLAKGGVDPSSPTAEHSVDSLAGATLTSRGVENLLRYWLGQNGFKAYLSRVKSGEANNV
jgi:Na+-transporting NADH:ubiquinone oxidoreductase subunit C